ncbi:MAG: hypothetical protein V1664_05430 [Candidatus Uhrbacteria bacterium]
MQRSTFSRKTRGFSGTSKLLLEIGNQNKPKEFVEIFQFRKNSSTFRGDLSRLKQKGLIETKSTRDSLLVKITEDGWFEYLRLKIEEANLLPEGKICIVVFDIPEKFKSKRNKLRIFLDKIGFLPLQKSVWIFQFDVAKILRDFFNKTEMDEWIRIFIAEEQD